MESQVVESWQYGWVIDGLETSIYIDSLKKRTLAFLAASVSSNMFVI